MADKPEFSELVERHGKEIFVFLFRLMQQSVEAEDCLQETYLRGFQAFDALDASANFRAWLYRIANNVAMTRLQRRARQAELLSDQVASPADPVEQQIETHVQLEALRSAVSALPAKQRAALVMRKYQELSYAEIGLALEIAPEAARANVYQGLKKLRAQFSAKPTHSKRPTAEQPPAAELSEPAGNK